MNAKRSVSATRAIGPGRASDDITHVFILPISAADFGSIAMRRPA
jgi:hypothetical protein